MHQPRSQNKFSEFAITCTVRHQTIIELAVYSSIIQNIFAEKLRPFDYEYSDQIVFKIRFWRIYIAFLS